MAEHLPGGFGLSVHWPFCQAKCPYCDFNSHVARDIDQPAWARAYLSEIARTAAELPGRILNTIYFGGGTPSLMAPDTVAAIIDAARRRWPTSNDMEVTLEANPGSVEAGRLAAYRDGGVNRVSLGIQALNDSDLRRLGRIHTAADARAALDIAGNTFERVSFDLIYARQDQKLRQWCEELSQALTMAGDHLSLYQLTVEADTAFGARHEAGKLRGLPGEDLAADMFDATQEICAAHGFVAYEVSNHARSGAQSRHNLIYWRGGDYVGIGPGAHGRITVGGRRLATESPLAPGQWLHHVGRGSGESGRTELTGREQAEDYVMMGLRIHEGLDLGRFAALNGAPFAAERIGRLVELGMISVGNGRLAATGRGRAVLNAVIRDLLAD
ncbi:MAG: radical SAM family heme chaperone HemW [Jhaorihella sp.]